MIDYSHAGKWAYHVRALAIVESQENEREMGDGGRAFGLLQMHADRFLQESNRFPQFKVQVGDTVTVAQIKAAACWFQRMMAESQPLVVMAWNLGEFAVFAEGKRNQEYYDRWKAAYDQARSDGGEMPIRS